MCSFTVTNTHTITYFVSIPQTSSCCWKYSQEQEMCPNPQLKIVPNSFLLFELRFLKKSVNNQRCRFLVCGLLFETLSLAVSPLPSCLFFFFFEMEVTLLVREGRAGEDILIGSDCERCSNDSSVTNFTLYSLSQLRTIIYKMNIILD